MKGQKDVKKPSLGLSLIPFVCLIGFMLLGVVVFKGEPQIPLILACGVTSIIGISLGYTWEELEDAMIQSNAMTMQANFIIMIVGCLIGTWIAGGVVPGMIFYGLKIFTPSMFLFLLPIICAIVAVSTGSAWSTAGTMGTAAMGIGAGLGIPVALTAGAVVTGSSFGDKMSPLSDSTNLASGILGVNVFDHIKHMLKTTVPSFLISIAIFGVIGMKYKGVQADTTQIDLILKTLQANFDITPIIFIAPISVILMVIFKVPAVPGMLGGTIIGVVFALIQGAGVSQLLENLFYGYNIATGNAMVDQLLNRGGMLEMMETISLVICAMCFGGLIKKVGCLDSILEFILRFCKTRSSILASNVLVCIAMNFMAADQYMAIVIPGQMYEPIYKKLNLHPKNLSRTLEDAGTLTSGLVPWSTCGGIYKTTLGVSAFQYGRFHFLGIINPILAILYGIFGIALEPLDPSKPIGTRYDADKDMEKEMESMGEVGI